MRDFDREMHRGLGDVVKRTNSDDWVNLEDKIAREFRANPVSQSEVEEKVSESVDGLPVKDRDLVEGEVDAPQVETHNVPEGNVREIVDWVGDDSEKAQLALEEEQNRENPRKTLVEKLKEIAED